MRQQRERAIARNLASLAIRHRTVLLATAFVLATSGCASQNVRGTHTETGAGNRDAQGRHLQYGSLNANRRFRRGKLDRLETALHDYYQQWQGVPYAYGGRSQKGIDCSSFVRHTFDAVESYELPRTTVEQARVGMSVSRANLEAGDLVFFRTGGASHHVGVYLGQGRFMHASSSEGVTISRLDNVYWRNHYWQSRRIIASTR